MAQVNAVAASPAPSAPVESAATVAQNVTSTPVFQPAPVESAAAVANAGLCLVA